MSAVEIVPYRETWPREFSAIRRSIGDALGRAALRIDHIGSTSVPGLGSKDIIDVQLTLESFDGFDAVQSALEPIGYLFRPNITSDHHPAGIEATDADYEKRYLRSGPESRDVHLHVRVEGRANQRYALLFRDYLRTHPRAAAAYEDLKRRLARHAGDDREAYVDTKDPVCDIVMAAAEDWITATDRT
jgi:GrpB-like predicted nucleotidyltransferase (UPF0157 family)